MEGLFDGTLNAFVSGVVLTVVLFILVFIGSRLLSLLYTLFPNQKPRRVRKRIVIDDDKARKILGSIILVGFIIAFVLMLNSK